MKKYLIWIIMAVLVIAVFIVFLQINGGDKLSERPDDENQNKIYIGVFVPFSGINSEGGYQERLGIDYAWSLCPTVNIGGVTYDIKLVYADNASDTDDAVSAAKNLVDKGVSAVLGSYGSTVTIAAENVLDSAKIPAVGISCSDPEITTKSGYYFRVGFLDSFQGEILAQYVFSQNLRKAAVLTQVGDNYSKGLAKSFSDAFAALGGTTVDFSFNTVTMSYADLIGEVKASGADFVFMPSPSEAGAQFINQMRDAGGIMPIYGGDTWDTQTLAKSTGKNGKDVFFSSQFDQSGTLDTTGADFTSKFSLWLGQDSEREKLNGDSREVSPVSALAYDAYNAVIAAIKSAGTTDPQAICSALSGVSFDGATGKIAFDENGDCSKSVAFIKKINPDTGKIETVQVSNASDK